MDKKKLKFFIKYFEKAYEVCKGHTKEVVFGILILFGFGLYGVSIYFESGIRSTFRNDKPQFEGGRILGTSKEIYERQEQWVSGKVKNLEKEQKDVHRALDELKRSVEELKQNPIPTEKPDESKINEGIDKEDVEIKKKEQASRVSPPPGNYAVGNVPPQANKSTSANQGGYQSSRRYVPPSGPEVISFPVEISSKPQKIGVHVPAGSFVRAKLLTGVEAPEGKPLPVLLQADYAFVGPNKTRIDLSGCFMIAKSTGNLSIERVEMQVTKISCVSKSGKMFERDLNAFVADDKDNSFAVMGSVNSKQDRVATMGFLSSVVEGIGKAIQQAQTQTNVNAEGGQSTTITGNQGRYIAAGGAAGAANLVTDWYLKQAQNLLPTINVGSGQDIWVVTQESIALPNWYFKSNSNDRRSHRAYSYLSRVMD